MPARSKRPLDPARIAAASVRTRRDFLLAGAGGLGGLPLAALLADDGRLAPADPLRPRPPHFAPRAKACIAIFMAGAPSQMDLFDPKPLLVERNGQPVPASLLEKVRFAFIQPKTATLLGSPRRFARHGECGMEFSDSLPNLAHCADKLLMVRSMHTEEFNHHPGQLMMQCGVSRLGMPAMGSWLTYGLGSESRELPGYVVLTAGRGSSGGATLWQSGFLPSSHAGVLFRGEGEPVLNLDSPPGLPDHLQDKGLRAITAFNREHHAALHDPEIASRIGAYELAGRMQTAAPELVDLSGESAATLAAYGIGRPEPKPIGRGTQSHLSTYNAFSRNCLLARRMVERGVRFVNIIHASWDQHSDLDVENAYNCGAVDQPIAALLEDLDQRGLLDETLVVWTSEFGRTPLGENRPGRPANTGRDHHPFAFTVLLAGGGLKRGLTYGSTDEIGWGVIENPVHVNDLHATLLHCFGLDHQRLTYRFAGRDFRLTDVAGRVIHDWLA